MAPSSLKQYRLPFKAHQGRVGPRLRRLTSDCTNERTTPGTSEPVPAGQTPTCGLMLGPGLLTSGGTTMDELADALSGFVDRVVVDRTSLAGYYEATLEFTPDFGGVVAAGTPMPVIQPSGTSAPGLFTSLREQLGLQLAPERGPVRVLVIDHIERPTPD